MGRRSIETRMRRIAMIVLAVTLSISAGAVAARWALEDTNDFYMAPTDRYAAPAYARRQPIADDFGNRQDQIPPAGSQAEASTATSAQPAYRSASGS